MGAPCGIRNGFPGGVAGFPNEQAGPVTQALSETSTKGPGSRNGLWQNLRNLAALLLSLLLSITSI